MNYKSNKTLALNTFCVTFFGVIKNLFGLASTITLVRVLPKEQYGSFIYILNLFNILITWQAAKGTNVQREIEPGIVRYSILATVYSSRNSNSLKA